MGEAGSDRAGTAFGWAAGFPGKAAVAERRSSSICKPRGAERSTPSRQNLVDKASVPAQANSTWAEIGCASILRLGRCRGGTTE
jgi:hypothetical protein